MKRALQMCLMCLALVTSLRAAENDAELKPFQGHWEVIELVEDGHVIPPDAIREWLPSGGRFEIIDNSLTYKSPEDGKKHARVFEIDPTQFPKGIDLLSRDKKEVLGIYRFDEGKLVVCLSDAADGAQPTEFSAKKGSKRMLMVLKKMSVADASAKAPHSPPLTGGSKILSDEELTKMLPGAWRYRDDIGSLVLTIRSNGTWSTIREVQELRLFQKVFVRTPVSNGTWVVKRGTLSLLCTASLHPDRVNHTMPFTVRSISENDLIFVDYMGRLGRASKVE
ncbi:TIGR03067 domain-containing protein [Schlesneria paludicola]|uniref:TIGR03067 domain-containing protein n=1 Tax=Schlesneria paludicola TaxID=360056 RepID=UPI000299E26C|nr:TIGR03067 domain-containing protein [Schlesneria paludicola]